VAFLNKFICVLSVYRGFPQYFFMSFFFYGSTALYRPGPPRFVEVSRSHFRHTTVGRTPLDEGPARRRDIYLTTHNTHNRQTSMPTVGFEPTILVSERPKTHSVDRTATGIGLLCHLLYNISVCFVCLVFCFCVFVLFLCCICVFVLAL
jgi:hypothetical protein